VTWWRSQEKGRPKIQRQNQKAKFISETHAEHGSMIRSAQLRDGERANWIDPSNDTMIHAMRE
jgi:hypothetical protein